MLWIGGDCFLKITGIEELSVSTSTAQPNSLFLKPSGKEPPFCLESVLVSTLEWEGDLCPLGPTLAFWAQKTTPYFQEACGESANGEAMQVEDLA